MTTNQADSLRNPAHAENAEIALPEELEQLLEQLESLLENNREQAGHIEQLRDEIAVLKGRKAKPKFKPSGMATETDGYANSEEDRDDSGGAKGSRFKGYRDFIVQDLRIQAHNSRYRLEVWQTPDDEQLPASRNGGHVGAQRRCYMPYQPHHCHVTPPLLHEQLCEWGIDISVG